MVKSFKHFAYVLGMAVALLGSSLSFATERAVSYTVRVAADTPYTMAKLEAELAYHADAKTMLAGSVNSDLMRDGHGLRQASALDIGVGTGSPEAVTA